jgi:cytochrome P450
MLRLSLRETQRLLREQGAEGTIAIRDSIRVERVGLMNVPLLNLFLPPVYYLTQPEDIHELLVKHGDKAQKVELVQRIARSTFGNGILMSNGALWKRQRKLMQPAFHHIHVREYGERMIRIAQQHLAQWQPNSTLDLAEEMHALTLKIVVDALFSSDATGDLEEVSQAIHDISAGFTAAAASVVMALLPDWFPAPAIRQKVRGAKNFKRILKRIVAERRQLGEANSPKDLLTALMYSRDETTGATMDDEQLRGELLTLYVAGHETTAWLLSWSLAFLQQNPATAQKLRDELAVLDGKPPTVDDLAQLPYSKMVLQETLRLRPPVWFIQRETHEPITLNGQEFPKKAMFMILIYANHHDAEIFPEPHTFKPERWENDAEKHLPKGIYTPFAIGSRICIGNGFAMMEAQLLLNLIMQCFQLELLDTPQLPKGTPIILGFSNPVRMQVK